MIELTTPRECVYRRFDQHPGPCPRCGADLERKYANYLIATRRGEEATDSILMGHNEGWFCPRCPTVVLNPDEIGRALLHPGHGGDVGTEFAPLGIVDIDAIPEEKAHLPIGGDDNPIPLVKFTDVIMDTKEPEEPRESPPRPDIQPRVTHRRREGTFEERYEDVLQNIEFGIVSVYRDHPEMSDWEALSAVEALIRTYRAEAKDRQAGPPSLDPLTEEVYRSVERLCEWRLGREPLPVEGPPKEVGPEPIMLDEMVDCLKRVRTSIKKWNRRAGRQGYLTFIDQFIG